MSYCHKGVGCEMLNLSVGTCGTESDSRELSLIESGYYRHEQIPRLPGGYWLLSS